LYKTHKLVGNTKDVCQFACPLSLQQILHFSVVPTKSAVPCGQFCRLPDVVNGYCLIVFPETKNFPFFTLFVTDLKPTARSELLYNG
jgi:hypothetical protein